MFHRLLMSVGPLWVAASALLLGCSGTHHDAQDPADPRQLGSAGDGSTDVSDDPDASGPDAAGVDSGEPGASQASPSSGEATYFTEFGEDGDWRRRVETGGAIRFGAAGGHDGSVLDLLFPGDPALGPEDRAGPAHATEVILEQEVHFGSYRTSVRPARCSTAEEVVNGIFVYANGGDANDNGITDNTEIDIEILCGEPHMILMTTWTDYENDSSLRAWRRVVDMRTGEYQEATHHDRYGVGPVLGTIPEAAAPDFPASGRFYEMGFDWYPDRIRWFIVLDGTEVTLWDYRDVSLIPQSPARFMLNVWHSPTHWFSGGAADYPEGDATMSVDWFGYWAAE